MIGLLIVVALIIWLLTSTFYDSGKWFTLAMIACFGAAVLTFGAAFFTFVMLNLKIILIGIIGYFVLGGIWSIFKWYRLNIKIRNSYNRAINNNSSKDYAKSYAKEINSVRSFPPVANEQKSTIVFWIVSWPFSIVTWILGDFVVDVCNYIYELLASVYTSITKSIFADFKD